MTNIDKNIWVENSVFAIQHGGNKKSFLQCFPPSPVTKLFVFAYSCSFTLHTSYIKWHDWSMKEGCQNAQIEFIIKAHKPLTLYRPVA